MTQEFRRRAENWFYNQHKDDDISKSLFDVPAIPDSLKHKKMIEA